MSASQPSNDSCTALEPIPPRYDDRTRGTEPTSPTPVEASGSIRHPQVKVVLTGTDGNAYSLIARVRRELRAQVDAAAAAEFVAEATACTSYDDLLVLIMRTVDVD